MKLGEAIELSHRHLSRLLAFLDANGYGQTDECPWTHHTGVFL